MSYFIQNYLMLMEPFQIHIPRYSRKYVASISAWKNTKSFCIATRWNSFQNGRRKIPNFLKEFNGVKNYLKRVLLYQMTIVYQSLLYNFYSKWCNIYPSRKKVVLRKILNIFRHNLTCPKMQPFLIWSSEYMKHCINNND